VACSYSWVYALKQDFPHLEFSLNGGIQSWGEVNDILAHAEDSAVVHGVMLGRAAFNMPWHVLACADTRVFGCATDPAISRRQVRHCSFKCVACCMDWMGSARSQLTSCG
jgi:tRNA-dihydrouridine synthase A